MKRGKWLDCGNCHVRSSHNPAKVANPVIVFGERKNEMPVYGFRSENLLQDLRNNCGLTI